MASPSRISIRHLSEAAVRLLGREKARSDDDALLAYSTDASLFGIKPRSVVNVTSKEDVVRVLELCRKERIAIIPRAAGTNLVGSAIGDGIILDFCGFNRILEISEEGMYARVEPGTYLYELDRALEGYRLMFAPDPGSQSMCRIGGMVGTNASGPRAVKYGSTKSHVEELKVLLWNGKEILAKSYRLDSEEFQHLLSENPEIEEVFNLIRSNLSLILERKPVVTKNSSGYNVFDLADSIKRGRFDLHKLFIGSEGTLGIVTEIKLRLVPAPRRRVTALAFLDDLDRAGEAALNLRTLGPSKLEMIESNLMDLMGRERFGLPRDAEVALFVEFDEDPELKLEELRKLWKEQYPRLEIRTATDPREQEILWRSRDDALPILYRLDRRKKPWPFVDDIVVPVERTPEMIRGLVKLSRDRDLNFGIFGHVGDGNVHYHPLVNLEDEEDFRKMMEIVDEAHRLAISLGGSLAGEHGDGRLRRRFLVELYGPELYGLMREIKQALDPYDILNPGVKIGENDYVERIDEYKRLEGCATCGKCNPVCPVFDIEQKEEMGPRGWFRILKVPYYVQRSRPALDYCLNCKSCTIICPAGIDVAGTVLERRLESPGNSLNELFFRTIQSNPSRLFRFTKLLGLTQRAWDRPGFRAVLEAISSRNLLTLHKDMILPRFSNRTLEERYPELKGNRASIAYFPGCASSMLADGVGDAVISVLRANGVDFTIPDWRCSGTPMITYGFVEDVKRLARFNLDSLSSFETVITSCASCNLSLKSYEQLFEDEKEYARKAEELASMVVDISEFLVSLPNFNPPKLNGGKRVKVTYHDPCHLRASGITEPPREVLMRLPWVEFVEMRDADRCCGGGGTYSMKNRKLSMDYFEARKRPAILESGADVVATSCPACQIQIRDGLRGSKRVLHVIQLVDETYRAAL